jgi:membrane protease YdiL (CAAX protease family)
MPNEENKAARSMFRLEPRVLGFGLVLPSIVTWAYFFQAESAAPIVQWIVFPAVKIIQFGLPIVWMALAMRQAVTLRPRTLAGVGAGLAFGAAVAGAIFLLYFGVLKESSLFDQAAQPIRDKIAGFKIDSVSKYAALGIFYSLCHSLLEEYYWRWFVFGRLKAHVTLWMAIVISSIGFVAHHVLVLSKFFGPGNWATWFFSLGVAVGGGAWAWLYHRSNSLLGPWLSHLLVDAAIFSVGFDLVRAQLAG